MKQKTYLHWGVTITAAACAILVFYDTFFQDGVLFIFIEKLFGILKPVLYGLAMAYLLTPIVDFFDRLLRDRLGVKRAGLMRCLSILVTWLLALGLVYLLFSILIPELVASVSLLFSNLESYYRTIYTWVTQLVEDNPYISERVLTLVRDYYNELVDWVKNTVIPGAQVAIVAVTGGVLSVLVFAKDLLVGIVVSVYILARKETFGLHTRKLLYSLVSAPHYERALRATREADRIFSGFVRGKLLDSLIIGILCFIVCSILKFPYTPIIAVFVGVTNIIPIFGPFLGAVPSAFLILLVSPKQCLYFILFIIALQAGVGTFCRGFRRGFGVRGGGFGAFRRGGTVALPEGLLQPVGKTVAHTGAAGGCAAGQSQRGGCQPRGTENGTTRDLFHAKNLLIRAFCAAPALSERLRTVDENERPFGTALIVIVTVLAAFVK